MGDIADGAYALENLTAGPHRRIGELCDRYAGADIGLVDAAVMGTAIRRFLLGNAAGSRPTSTSRSSHGTNRGRSYGGTDIMMEWNAPL